MLFALRRAVSLAAPPACGCCELHLASRGAGASAGGLICPGCERELRAVSPCFGAAPVGADLAVAAADYEGAARRLAHAIKFRRRIGLVPLAAELIARACPAEELRGAVVPVPAAPWRRRWRGFDPAEEIALALAALADLDYRPCLRRAQGPRQVGRARHKRLADPPRVRPRPPVPTRALLVDDVRTTGATLAACAGALRAGGSEQVLALTLARSRQRGL